MRTAARLIRELLRAAGGRLTGAGLDRALAEAYRAGLTELFDERQAWHEFDGGEGPCELVLEADRPAVEPTAAQMLLFPADGQPVLNAHMTCPSCGKRHVDEGEWATRPHLRHRCVDDVAGQGCGHEWAEKVYRRGI
jgi:hypothetical protein